MPRLRAPQTTNGHDEDVKVFEAAHNGMRATQFKAQASQLTAQADMAAALNAEAAANQLQANQAAAAAQQAAQNAAANSNQSTENSSDETTSTTTTNGGQEGVKKFEASHNGQRPQHNNQDSDQ
jgi:hypothetical protein